MCGVFGYAGTRSVVNMTYNALNKLAYRGYDSAGISVMYQNDIATVKTEGKVSKLEPLLSLLPENANIGLGHTRWATHGSPTTANAHPHTANGVSVVHNGILENYQSLKIDLLQQGFHFSSETDTEVLVHLLRVQLSKGLQVKAALLSMKEIMEGAYALGIICNDDPDAIYVVKQGSPIVIGLGNGENFFASDVLALLEHTERFIFLEDGEMARISAKGVEIWDAEGHIQNKTPTIITQAESSMDKGGFRHYMLKEVHEQPTVVARTIQQHVNVAQGTLNAESLGLNKLPWDSFERIHVVACGTAYYAGLLGKYIIESITEIPVEVELASEYRYRKSFQDKRTLVIPVSQSGETIDTLMSVQHAKKKGCSIFAICNVQHSSIAREAHFTLHMNAGAEIGVASTKAFTSMLLNFYLFALGLGQKRGRVDQNQLNTAIEELQKLPTLIDQALNSDALISEVATAYFESAHMLFIGRGHFFPVALEGALKTKEISYIHAEGYAAGELKHGPIALLDRNMPVVVVAPACEQYEKVLANLEEVSARGAKVIAVGHKSDARLRILARHVIPCPESKVPALQALLATIPLQLLAYHMAIHRGTDVDQPRNLAKSVTVE